MTTKTPWVDEEGLHYEAWVHIGEMLYNRDALGVNHPEQTYNHLVHHGIKPEDYGINHPYTERFANKTRSALIAEIVNLEEQLESAARHGFY